MTLNPNKKLSLVAEVALRLEGALIEHTDMQADMFAIQEIVWKPERRHVEVLVSERIPLLDGARDLFNILDTDIGAAIRIAEIERHSPYNESMPTRWTLTIELIEGGEL